jgi:hypothetical protein
MRNKDNFIDYVFERPEGLVFNCSDEGEVTVDMENKGFTNKVAQKFFKRPSVSHIKLEGMGSFIFTKIDGNRSVYDIGLLLKEEYGDSAEPLYERLSVFMKHLESAGFVTLHGQSD